MKGSLVLFSLLYFSFLFSLHVSSSSPPSKHHHCDHGDALLLLQFKNLFNINKNASAECKMNEYPIREKTLSWNESSDCCKWEGVTCDSSTGHVIELDLNCSGLQGPIYRNNSLFQLHHLQKLNLAYNDFCQSPLPHEVGNLTRLTHLNLYWSSLSGTLPSEISYLSKLVSLDLSFNNFDGNDSSLLFLQNLTMLEVFSLFLNNISCTIPRNISASLRDLDLTGNNIVGNIPDSIFQLPKLQSLSLSGNSKLVGSLPKFSWSCNHTLQRLDLGGTCIFGELPNSIGNLKFLNYFSLYESSFSGSIPESIGNLTLLEVLDLGSNEFNGSVPFTISNLNQLTKLDLSANHFDGELPDAFSNLQEVITLYLQGNNFTSLFPSSIVNMTQLEDLLLDGNSLFGSFPPVASGLQNLWRLDLSENALNGTIPPWIFSIPSLTTLDLSQNRFTGKLPEIASRSLEYVALSHNQLDGSIPHSISNLVNARSLNFTSNNFSGDVTIEMFSSKNLLELDLSFNHLSWSNTWSRKFSTFIEKLDLSSCEIREFPTFIRNLTSLEYLDLSNTKLSGQIPTWFTSMEWSEMSYLSLSQNSFTSVDQLLFPNLRFLDLHSNQLQGPLTITICNSSKLKYLNLKYNKFDGTVPKCLGELGNLSVLDLGKNNFNGIVPTMFAKGNNLTTIDLNGNQLQGLIPRSLVNCTKLEVLDLGDNKLNDKFPKWLGDLLELQVLILSSNKLYGPITSLNSKIWFPKLRIFDLSDNGFFGALPKYFFNDFKAMVNNVTESQKEASYLEIPLPGKPSPYHISINLVIKGQDIQLERVLTILTTIDLSSNQIEGEIPMLIGNLNSLRLLNLSHNHLNGSIPHQLGNLKLLESLDISCNKLTGKIPEQITSLTFLEVLNLSQNHLVGPIPRGKQFNTFGNDSYGRNLNLCGFPLSRECNNNNNNNKSHEPKLQHVEPEEKSDFLSGFTWRVVVIGFGCGVVFGIIMENLMFQTRKPEWLVNFYGGMIRKAVPRPKRNGHRH